VVDCPGERPVRENLRLGVGTGGWRRTVRFWRCTRRWGTARPGSSTISPTAPAPYFISAFQRRMVQIQQDRAATPPPSAVERVSADELVWGAGTGCAKVP